MRKRANILFINTLYHPYIGGGAEIILRTQVNKFRDRGYTVSVLTIGNQKGINYDFVDGVKIYRVEFKNLYWHFNSQKPSKIKRLGWHLIDIYNFWIDNEVNEVLNLEKPDLVICHNLSGFSISAWSAIKRHKTPIIQVLHDLYLKCPNANMFSKSSHCKSQCSLCSILRLPHTKLSNTVDAVVGVSHYVLNNLTQSGYFKDSLKYVIHNARSMDIVRDKKIGLIEKSIKFGFLGTIAPSKGVEWLLEQFMLLEGEHQLIVAGRGDVEYVENLKHKYNSPRVNFLGYTDFKSFYKLVDVAVVPSIWPDTFPGVAFEACANGVPVIASDIGGLPEIIQNEINGLLCDVSEHNSLLKAMQKLISDKDLLNILIKNSAESVLNLIDEERMIREYEVVIENVLVKNSENHSNMY